MVGHHGIVATDAIDPLREAPMPTTLPRIDQDSHEPLVETIQEEFMSPGQPQGKGTTATEAALHDVAGKVFSHAHGALLTPRESSLQSKVIFFHADDELQTVTERVVTTVDNARLLASREALHKPLTCDTPLVPLQISHPSIASDSPSHNTEPLTSLCDRSTEKNDDLLSQETGSQRSVSDTAGPQSPPVLTLGDSSTFGMVLSCGSCRTFTLSTGQQAVRTPLTKGQGRYLNVKNFVASTFGKGPILPGKFVPNKHGTTYFIFDDSLSAQATARQVTIGPVAHGIPTYSIDWTTYQVRLPMGQALGTVRKWLSTGITMSMVAAKKAGRSVYRLMNEQEYLHTPKVKAHARALEKVHARLAPLDVFAPTDGPLYLLTQLPQGGRRGQRIQQIRHAFGEFQATLREAHTIYDREQQLHESEESDTRMYRVVFSESYTTGKQNFDPEFLDEVRPCFEKMSDLTKKTIELLSDEVRQIRHHQGDAALALLKQTAPHCLHTSIAAYALYDEGLRELATAHSVPGLSPQAFQALARVYIHEFVDAVESGLLKERFSRTNKGRAFAASIRQAYQELLNAEQKLMATQSALAASNAFSRMWRTVNEDHLRSARKAKDAAMDQVIAALRAIHLNVILQKLLQDDAAPATLLTTSEGICFNRNNPLMKQKRILIALLKGESIADGRAKSQALSLLPALGRLPLYSPTGRHPGEQSWLAIELPQRLCFGECVSPSSLATRIIECYQQERERRSKNAS
jgi:hypothetical protein